MSKPRVVAMLAADRVFETGPHACVHYAAPRGWDGVTLCGRTDWIGDPPGCGVRTRKPVTCRGCLMYAEWAIEATGASSALDRVYDEAIEAAAKVCEERARRLGAIDPDATPKQRMVDYDREREARLCAEEIRNLKRSSP